MGGVRSIRRTVVSALDRPSTFSMKRSVESTHNLFMAPSRSRFSRLLFCVVRTQDVSQ